MLGFILWLAAAAIRITRFATALGTLVAGLGLGGLNYRAGHLAGRAAQHPVLTRAEARSRRGERASAKA